MQIIQGKEILIAVLDGEEAYINRLTGYINNKEKRGIRLTGFTNREKLKTYLKISEVSAVLCTEDEEENLKGESMQTLLVFGRDIDKYQAADELADEVKRRIFADKPSGIEDIEVFAVCSASPDYRLELLGRQIAEEKAQTGKTVLLNLLPFSRNRRDWSKTVLSETIYQLKKSSSVSLELLPAGNPPLSYDVLEGVDYWGDLNLLTEEDTEILFRELSGRFKYKNIVVVLDLMTHIFETVLDAGSSIYCPEPECVSEKEYFEEMKRQMIFTGRNFQDKIVMCRSGKGNS